MNIDQLLDAMADSDPDPNAVLDLVHRKRRAARTRAIYAASSGLAVVVAVALGLVVHGLSPGASSSRSAASSGAYPGPGSGQGAASAATGLAPGARAATNGPAGILAPQDKSAACTQTTLAQLLATAVRSGASVIVGSATLASGTAAEHATGSTTAYYAVTLHSVRTLAGPAVAQASTVWIAGASSAGGSASAAPITVAPAGQLFGIVYPSAHSGLPGPVLQAAAVVRGQVILDSAGCWDATAFPASVPQGIALTFGSSSPGNPASTEISLAAAEKLGAGA